MATYTAVITVSIEAGDDQEAYEKYLGCDWDVDGHDLIKYDDNGQEILVDESELEYTY
jgi:hypothetical protein